MLARHQALPELSFAHTALHNDPTAHYIYQLKIKIPKAKETLMSIGISPDMNGVLSTIAQCVDSNQDSCAQVPVQDQDYGSKINADSLPVPEGSNDVVGL